MENHPFEEKTSEKPVGIEGKNGGTLYPGYHGQNVGRPPGSKNRATVLRKYIDLVIKRRNPITGVEEELPVEDFMELEMIDSVLLERNPKTYQEIKDTLYGKLTDNVNLTGEVDLSKAIQFNVDFTKPADEQKPDGT